MTTKMLASGELLIAMDGMNRACTKAQAAEVLGTWSAYLFDPDMATVIFDVTPENVRQLRLRKAGA